MVWLFVAIGAGVLLALGMIQFGLRRSVWVLGAIMLAGLILLIWYAEFRNNGPEAFPENAIRLQGFTVTEAGPGRYRVTGRVFNDSTERNLHGFALRVLAKDCPKQGGCVVIGDRGASLDIEVPAGQARDLEHVFEFAGMRPAGALNWGYRLTPRE